ncbi:MAG: Na+/H+ antiporter [Candidatus Eremiobacteraeota bacterium]|nr:Na+/H+ antiporter [Candidatus Eremiobacteraeota bacterium]MBV8499693.1 Na+/H+ antiporter [Candidatus Eremiobacteraeota bacterium]
MSQASVLVTFLGAVVVLAVLAKRLRVPYPIAFTIGGIALAFARHLPRPHIEPDLIMLLVVPPLLYSAAWSTDWVALKRNARPIAFLAVGLVIVTMLVVAVVVHAVLPEFTWPLAFTLGAIVSPPDAVAAEAIFERLAIPRRVAAIISGECLMNDATALVLYRFAIAAAVSGTFSLARASIAFVIVAAGGTLVGMAVALLLEGVLRQIGRLGFGDAMIASVVFLLAPFAAYLAAEELHVSGVLAAVSAGLLLSRRSVSFIDPETRVLGSAVWRLLTFVLNAFAFLLIGLELPSILAALEPHVRDYALYGLLVSVTVILVRIAWVFPATYLPRSLNARLRRHDPSPAWQPVAVLAWAGMRGIVSLAVALSLPYTLGDQPFAARSVMIFLTFCVVFFTLVVQGLTLGPLIEWLGVTETSRSHRRETGLRIRALEAGIVRLQDDRVQHASALEREIADRVLEEYRQRIDVLRGKSDQEGGVEERESRIDRKVQKEALAAERDAIVAMRRAGEIPDDIYRSIEYDLDLATLRLS